MAHVDGWGRFVVMRFKRVKTWSRLHDVRRHNLREMECRHLEEDAPAPKLIFGSADVAEHVRGVLDGYGVEEHPGAVLALEFVVSTSREVFEDLDQAQYKAKLIAFMTCTGKALMDRFTIPGQIASIVLHEDERTPHIHAVVVPLIHEPDNRRKDKSPIYRLSAKRVVGGRGDMSREQTRFASHFEEMGLVRGKVRSRARHVSNRDHEALLEAARVKAAEEGEKFAREREVISHEAKELDQKSIELNDYRTALLAYRDQLKQERERLAAERVELAALQKEAEGLKARAMSRTGKLRQILIAGERFEQQVRELTVEQCSPAVTQARRAASEIATASRAASNDDQWLSTALFERTSRLGRSG